MGSVTVEHIEAWEVRRRVRQNRPFQLQKEKKEKEKKTIEIFMAEPHGQGDGSIISRRGRYLQAAKCTIPAPGVKSISCVNNNGAKG